GDAQQPGGAAPVPDGRRDDHHGADHGAVLLVREVPRRRPHGRRRQGLSGAMRALYVSTRLAGTDGVSLETHKVRRVLEGLGFEAHYCAGELDAPARRYGTAAAEAPEEGAPEADAIAERYPPGTLVPEFHFQDPTAVALGARAFASDEPDPARAQDLDARAAELARRFDAVVDDVRPDLVVLQNVWAIPMQLPLAKALADVVARRRLPTLSHEHDYPWERERF